MQQIRAAVETYMVIAYEAGSVPAAVRSRVETLCSAGAEDICDAAVFERDAASAGRRKLRLGNRMYPHMKLVIDQSPDGRHYFFRVDTHDQHARPDAASPEYAAFLELMHVNQELAQKIEAAWDLAGLPTFKAYLREDLARRRGT
jgi:hypothetical protein